MEPLSLTRFTRPDPSRADGLAVQIYGDLHRAIASGAIAQGQELPSSRNAAKALGVSRNTLGSAYDLLRAEGLIEIAPNRRPVVTHRPPPDGAARQPTPQTNHGVHLLESGWAHDYRANLFLSRSGALSPGTPDSDLFPNDAWARALRRVSRRRYVADQAFEDPPGYRPLREELAARLARDRGMQVDPSQILITTSTQASLSLAAQLLARSGDRVLMEDPGYMGARAAMLGAGLRPVSMSLDEEGALIPPDGAAGNARLIYLTPSNQYPMACRLSLARRLALIDHARATGAIILEDDYDSEFHWRGREIAAMHALGSGDEVIYLGTASKALARGMRLGWMVLPPALVAPFAQAQRNLGIAVNVHVQAALADLMASGEYRAHLRRITRIYAQRGQMLATRLTERFANSIAVRAPDGGLQMPLLFRAAQDEGASLVALDKAGFSPGRLSGLCIDAQIEGLIVGFADATPERIEAFCDVLETCWS